MVVSAQVSIYPLRQEHLSPAIQKVSAVLTACGLQPKSGRMSTMVTGEAELVFAAPQEAFVHAAILATPSGQD